MMWFKVVIPKFVYFILAFCWGAALDVHALARKISEISGFLLNGFPPSSDWLIQFHFISWMDQAQTHRVVICLHMHCDMVHVFFYQAKTHRVVIWPQIVREMVCLRPKLIKKTSICTAIWFIFFYNFIMVSSAIIYINLKAFVLWGCVDA